MKHYSAEGPRESSQPSTVIYQKNPIMICQMGPNNNISIENSEAVQIGHGNSIVNQMAPWESGKSSEGHHKGASWGSCSVWAGAGKRGIQLSQEKGWLSDRQGPLLRPPENEEVSSCLDQTLPDFPSFQYL